MKREDMMAGLILVSTVLLTTAAGVTTGGLTDSFITRVFTDVINNGVFRHLVVDSTTGKMYLGADNRLYQLSEEVELQKQVDTGPREDNPECHPEIECMADKTFTASVNKALLIDYHHNRLIACSNLYLGFCEKRTLGDITNADDPIYETLVPNDEVSSVYMFIAPGPTTMQVEDNERPGVLYIGATYSRTPSVYSDFLPAVSSKKLTDFELVNTEVEGRTMIEVETTQRNTFRVNYLYGFPSEEFSYFLAVQRESLESQIHVTRILRVCQNDKFYRSYTEIPLECNLVLPNRTVPYKKLLAAHVTHPGALLAQNLGLPGIEPRTDGDRVMFALFERSDDQEEDNTPASVMCAFPLPEIKRMFTTTIQQCFKGVGNTGPAHITIVNACRKMNIETIPIGDDYCGTFPLNYPIAGSRGTTGQALIHFPDATTSLAVTNVDDYTVAFVGTSQGIIKKVMIESSQTANVYGSHVVDNGSPVNPDLKFDRSKTHLYVVTDKQVAQLRVERCDLHTTCSECLLARDPYCGWCSLQNKCSLKTECDNNDELLWWLSPYKGVSCARILQVDPQKVQIRDEIHVLTLRVQNLPRPRSGTYECMFSGEGMVSRSTQATLIGTAQTNNTIYCETPKPNLLPRISTGKDHINMNLSIRMDMKNFVSTNFTFFDCGLHESCTYCTNSEFPCTWCVQHNTCTFQREVCGQDIMITGRRVPGRTDYAGPRTCPRIEGSFTEILVPEGFDRSITVQALHLQDFQRHFQCEFHLKTMPMMVLGEKVGEDFIKCGSTKFAYRGDSKTRNVPFKIKWTSADDDNWRPLDNPDNIQGKPSAEEST